MTTINDLVILRDPRSAAAEAYRTLRTNLIFAGLAAEGRPLQTLLVTTPAADEGKGLTLANLAVVMAQGGRQTILVDCDLRRPHQHEIFGLPSAPGFSDWMQGAEEAPAPLAATGVDGLRLLPAGAPTAAPADLLSSRRLQALVAGLKAQADIILFDAPPLLAVSDAVLLAANLDGVLLAVNAGHTRRDHAQRAKELLEKVHIRVVGAVLVNAAAEGGLSGY
jgi:non-specific protein-tyrosine kinase